MMSGTWRLIWRLSGDLGTTFSSHMLTWARNHLMKAMSLSASSCLLGHFSGVQINVDGSASFHNRKADIFFSKSEEPENTGTNFFSQRSFPSLDYFCFSPPGIRLATILHLAMFRVTGLLVVPVWPSSSFWSSIAPVGRHLPTWAVRRVRFGASSFWVTQS